MDDGLLRLWLCLALRAVIAMCVFWCGWYAICFIIRLCVEHAHWGTHYNGGCNHVYVHGMRPTVYDTNGTCTINRNLEMIDIVQCHVLVRGTFKFGDIQNLYTCFC